MPNIQGKQWSTCIHVLGLVGLVHQGYLGPVKTSLGIDELRTIKGEMMCIYLNLNIEECTSVPIRKPSSGSLQR